ncbi:MAG: hypothetical protein AAGG50_20685 [Bacteroidota bacterium]
MKQWGACGGVFVSGDNPCLVDPAGHVIPVYFDDDGNYELRIYPSTSPPATSATPAAPAEPRCATTDAAKATLYATTPAAAAAAMAAGDTAAAAMLTGGTAARRACQPAPRPPGQPASGTPRFGIRQLITLVIVGGVGQHL